MYVEGRQRRCDLLHGLKAVASGHRMTGLPKQTVPVPPRTQREPAAYRRNARFLPRYRAVARSRRPHRNPCHCRVTNRPRSSPPLVCWGPASHRFRRKVGPLGHKKTFGWASSSATVLRFLGRSVRSTPACSFLGSDSASEHSSLTGRRGYALVSLSGPYSLVDSETAKHPTSKSVNSRGPLVTGVSVEPPLEDVLFRGVRYPSGISPSVLVAVAAVVRSATQ